MGVDPVMTMPAAPHVCTLHARVIGHPRKLVARACLFRW